MKDLAAVNIGEVRFENLVGSDQSRTRIRAVTMGNEQAEQGVLFTTLDVAVNWIRKNSI